MKKFFIRLLQMLGILVVAFMGMLVYKGQVSQDMKFPGTFAEGQLGICGVKPNCVSSFHDQTHERYIKPQKFDTNPLLNIEKHLKDACQIIEKKAFYHRYQCETKIFGFVDDLELLFDEDDMLLHYRSSSRVGHSDLGANRKRIQMLLDAK